MNNIRFEIINGNPTEEERKAIYEALYKRYNPQPSLYNAPQLRGPYWDFRRQ